MAVLIVVLVATALVIGLEATGCGEHARGGS